MSFVTVDLVDSFTRDIVCKSTIVVYEDRRLYVSPSVEPLVTGRVVYLQSSHDPPSSWEVHREFSTLLLSFGEAVLDFFLKEDDDEYDELSSGSYFFLTEGLAIRVNEARPELLQTSDESGVVSTLAVFHTEEGILPHRMVSNEPVDPARMCRMLLERFQTVDPADLDSTELVSEDTPTNGLYKVFFRNARVIPLH